MNRIQAEGQLTAIIRPQIVFVEQPKPDRYNVTLQDEGERNVLLKFCLMLWHLTQMPVAESYLLQKLLQTQTRDFKRLLLLDIRLETADIGYYSADAPQDSTGQQHPGLESSVCTDILREKQDWSVDWLIDRHVALWNLFRVCFVIRASSNHCLPTTRIWLKEIQYVLWWLMWGIAGRLSSYRLLYDFLNHSEITDYWPRHK